MSRERVGRRAPAMQAPVERTLLRELLEAVEAHSEWWGRTHLGPSSPEEAAKRHRLKDGALYEISRRIEAELARYTAHEGICFDREMIDAILCGRKTVMRKPVMFTRSNDYLPPRYSVGGGPGGSYALQVLPENRSSTEPETIAGYRLKIVDVVLERCFDDVDWEQARLEGFDTLADYEAYWLEFGWGKQEVWRYEFEVIEL